MDPSGISSRAISGPANTCPVTELTFLGGLVRVETGFQKAEGLSLTGLKGRAIAIATLPCRRYKAPLRGLLPWLQPLPLWRSLCIQPCQERHTKATCMKVLTRTASQTVSRLLRGLVLTKQTFLHLRETLLSSRTWKHNRARQSMSSARHKVRHRPLILTILKICLLWYDIKK